MRNYGTLQAIFTLKKKQCNSVYEVPNPLGPGMGNSSPLVLRRGLYSPRNGIYTSWDGDDYIR